ncbi:hypothetical protein NP233_g3737 [Leucocoprinus birnbaumii]|uniref:Uncharacterized protein n=1 Tax=Leucocoprinus birnbaumii TaxID=56174 RepID=A0AAD5VYN2_9AGAR|nr:hypothetical protein NP233_g3737 [Leucocoprinus birnbaumii]
MPLSKKEISLLKELKPECLQKCLSDWNFKMSTWTHEVVLAEFAKRFGAEADSSKQKQLYDWVQNHCRTAVNSDSGTDSDSEGSTTSGVSSDSDPDRSENVRQSPRCRQGFRAIVIANNKSTIKSMIHASHSAEEMPALHEYIALWNNAVTKLIDNLPQEVYAQYKREAVKNKLKQLHGPTIEEIYNVQKGLHARAAEVLLELLGWDRKQYGDALFFVLLAYQDKSDNVRTQRVFVSNVKDYNKHKKPFLKKYDTRVAAEMVNLAACSFPKEVNPTDDILWRNLEDPNRFSQILAKHSALEFFACLNPDKLKRQEMEHLAFQLNLDPTLLTFKNYAPSNFADSTSVLSTLLIEITKTGPSDVGLIGDSASSGSVYENITRPLYIPWHPPRLYTPALVIEEPTPLTGPVDDTQAAQANNTILILQSDAPIFAPFQPHTPLTDEGTAISPGEFSVIHSTDIPVHMTSNDEVVLTSIIPALKITGDDQGAPVESQVPTSVQLQEGTQNKNCKKNARKGNKQTKAQGKWHYFFDRGQWRKHEMSPIWLLDESTKLGPDNNHNQRSGRTREVILCL